jgi:hypothetical protein
VISVEGKGSSSKVYSKVFHAAEGSLHFEKEGGVVFLRPNDPAAGISNDVVLSVGANLDEFGGEVV